MPVVVFKVFGKSTNSNTNLENGMENRTTQGQDSRTNEVGIINMDVNSLKTQKQRLESRPSLSPSLLPKFSRHLRRNRLASVQDKDWKAELPFENLLSHYANRKVLHKVGVIFLVTNVW